VQNLTQRSKGYLLRDRQAGHGLLSRREQLP